MHVDKYFCKEILKESFPVSNWFQNLEFKAGSYTNTANLPSAEFGPNPPRHSLPGLRVVRLGSVG